MVVEGSRDRRQVCCSLRIDWKCIALQPRPVQSALLRSVEMAAALRLAATPLDVELRTKPALHTLLRGVADPEGVDLTTFVLFVAHSGGAAVREMRRGLTALRAQGFHVDAGVVVGSTLGVPEATEHVKNYTVEGAPEVKTAPGLLLAWSRSAGERWDAATVGIVAPGKLHGPSLQVCVMSAIRPHEAISLPTVPAHIAASAPVLGAPPSERERRR